MTIRFTFVTDEGNPEEEYVEGWTVDDVRIIDRYQIENRACVPSSTGNLACDEVQEGGTIMYDHYGVEIDEMMDDLYAQIYPNPTSDMVSIRLSGDWNENPKVKIVDIQGKLVFETVISEIDVEIATDKYADGMYFVEISDDIHYLMKKLTVLH